MRGRCKHACAICCVRCCLHTAADACGWEKVVLWRSMGGSCVFVCALLFIVRAAIFSLLMYDVVDGKGGGAMEGHTCVFLRVY